MSTTAAGGDATLIDHSSVLLLPGSAPPRLSLGGGERGMEGGRRAGRGNYFFYRKLKCAIHSDAARVPQSSAKWLNQLAWFLVNFVVRGLHAADCTVCTAYTTQYVQYVQRDNMYTMYI